MISPPEARAIYQCLISLNSPPEVRPQPNILNQKFEHEKVLESARSNDIDPQYIENLIADNVLNKNIYEYCDRHGSAVEVCGCDSGTTRTELSINGQYLVNKWVDWIRSTGAFREVNSDQIAPQRWEITAKYNQKNLKFQLFFDHSDMESYDIEPFALEFGFSFLADQYLPEGNLILPWYAPIDNLGQFKDDIDDLIREYTGLISASFIDKSDVEDFRRKVRNEIRDYLIEKGYEPTREVGECRGTFKYNINPEGDDLLMQKEDGQLKEILICRCSSGGGYHLHGFVDNQIVTVDGNDEYSYLLDRIEENIDEYIDIQTSKNRSSNATNIISTLAAGLSGAVLFDGTFDITGRFSALFPEVVSSIWIQLGLLILNLGILLTLLAIIIKPYIDDYRFEWDVPEYDAD